MFAMTLPTRVVLPLLRLLTRACDDAKYNIRPANYCPPSHPHAIKPSVVELNVSL
jgi:hypothetical protein